jgi:uncharacterized protein
MENNSYKTMHPNLLKSMLVKRIGFILVLAITGSLVYYFQTKIQFSLLGLSLFYSGIFLLALALVFLAKAYFRRKKFKIAEKNISYQEGILYQKETLVPFARIQHIEIDEGPLERFFSIATLSIYTAGDSGRDLKISGLELMKAQEIKSFISNYIKDE